GRTSLAASRVFNCTYARLNQLLAASGVTPVRLKHELTEMALVEVPSGLEGKAFTMMCGPFFSLMPFPPRGLHTLSHVRYTPHYAWEDTAAGGWRDPYAVLRQARRDSNFPPMIRDVSRYMPILRSCRHVDSIWE